MTAMKKPEPKAKGTFAKTPFAHILVYLWDRETTGTLEVEDGSNKISAYFQKGTPAKAESSIPGRTLGVVLQKQGVITEEHLKAAETAISRTGDLLGRTLVDQKAIDTPTLIRGLKQQLLVKLTDIFAMTEANYSFYERVDLLHRIRHDELFPLDPLPLIMSGLRKHGSRLNLDTLCDGLIGKWISATDVEKIRRFKLRQPEKDLLEKLLEKPHSYDSLLSGGPFDPAMVKYLLYGLCITRLIEVDSPPGDNEKGPQTEEDVADEGRPSRLESLDPGPVIMEPEDPELAERRRNILGKAVEIAAQNYYEMLGLQPEATPDDARRAFFKLAKVYHPDRVPPALASELRETLQYIFSNLSAAHTTLTDPDLKDEYDLAFKSRHDLTSDSPISADESKVRDVLEGENLYQKALVHLRRNQQDTARELVDRALALNAEDGEYRALWAHLEWRRRPKDAKNEDLLDALRGAVESNPKSERAHLYFAQVLNSSERTNEARQHFEKVLSINAHNIEAARELRLIKMRQKKEKEKPAGFFSRFLK